MQVNRSAHGHNLVGRLLRSDARFAVNVEIPATRIFLRAGGQARTGLTRGPVRRERVYIAS
jgi:hypothetical protein